MDFINGIASFLEAAGNALNNTLSNSNPYLNQAMYGNYPPYKTCDFHYRTGGTQAAPDAICVNCTYFKKSNAYCRMMCKNTTGNGVCDAFDKRVTPDMVQKGQI